MRVHAGGGGSRQPPLRWMLLCSRLLVAALLTLGTVNQLWGLGLGLQLTPVPITTGGAYPGNPPSVVPLHVTLADPSAPLGGLSGSVGSSVRSEGGGSGVPLPAPGDCGEEGCVLGSQPVDDGPDGMCAAEAAPAAASWQLPAPRRGGQPQRVVDQQPDRGAQPRSHIVSIQMSSEALGGVLGSAAHLLISCLCSCTLLLNAIMGLLAGECCGCWWVLVDGC